MYLNRKILFSALVPMMLFSIFIIGIYIGMTHNRLKLLGDGLARFKIPAQGVIHIGASTGQEENLYEELKFKNILWIEADPEIASDLKKKMINKSGVEVASFAASDKNGEAEFIRTNNQQSSSLLELDLHKKVHQDIIAVDKIKVKTRRLDDFLLETDVKNKYNVLVVDTQGAELLVLNGAVDTLKHIDIIHSEFSYIFGS